MTNVSQDRTSAPASSRAAVAAGRATKRIFGKLAIGLAAVIATGFFSIDPVTEARPRSTPVPAFSDRFVFDIPAPATQAVDLSMARNELAAALAQLRTTQHENGVPARYVTIERRTGPAASELVRYRVTDVARQ